MLRPSELVAGPHRRGFEIDFARRGVPRQPYLFLNADLFKPEGNLNRNRLLNSQGRFDDNKLPFNNP